MGNLSRSQEEKNAGKPPETTATQTSNLGILGLLKSILFSFRRVAKRGSRGKH